LTNARFENNRAIGTGGGMYRVTTAFPRLTAAQFISNSANANGGGALSV
jgi:predicted outer membrane repeat protein